jgi:hypothetical protein
MEVFFLPGEELFLTFHLVKGSGWLTSHRLIIAEHTTGKTQRLLPKNIEKPNNSQNMSFSKQLN